MSKETKYPQGDTPLDVMGEYAFVAYHEELVRRCIFSNYLHWSELTPVTKDLWIHVAMTVIGAYNTRCYVNPFTRVDDE